MFNLTPHLVSHATLAVSGMVLAVGWVGRAWIQEIATGPAVVAACPPPVEILSLQLEPAARVDAVGEPAPAEASTPALRAAPGEPGPVVVAPPGATPAFAVAVSGPVIDSAQVATASADARRVSSMGLGERIATPVETLTFGTGAGAQPAPGYPREARRKGMEGDVTVQFAVDASGAVATAQVVNASAWDVLNDAAVDTIRGRWRFAAGRERRYEITIRFRLTR